MLGGQDFLLKGALFPLLSYNFLLRHIKLVSDLILQILAFLEADLKFSNDTLRVAKLCLQLANFLRVIRLVSKMCFYLP